MAAQDAVLPEALVCLSALVGEVLGGPPAPATALDETLVTLALRRHQVGPLLHAAVASGRHAIAPALRDSLAQSYRASAAGRAAALARLEQIGGIFAARDIGWIPLKGAMQAGLLYTDPAWRSSADIDILVPPGQFQAALEALTDGGFIASNPPLPPRALRRPILFFIRDVLLIARDDHSCAVDLHSRLYVGGAEFSLAVTTGGAPAIGPELALYLIMHGALSYWVRLKWLVDLVPLFARLGPTDCADLVEQARRLGVENSVAASLLLLRALFAFVSLDGLEPWLARRQFDPRVQRRLRRYIQMLELTDDQRGSPLSDALVTLEANWLLFEKPSARARLLAMAPVSSLVRRFAHTLNPADRALTLLH